jgi:hypothetical protein
MREKKGKKKKRKKEKMQAETAATPLAALCVVANATHSAAVRHALSRTCTLLRAAARAARPERGCESGVARCFADGHACVSSVVRSFCAGRLTTERLISDSIAEAVGAVRMCGVTVADLEARGWGEYARLRHMCTLIVAGAVNVDTWRVIALSDARRRAVYFELLRATDAWAALA